MSELPPRPRAPEDPRREAYRHLSAIALNSARHYNGTEDSYTHLMAALEAVEEYVGTLGFTGDIRRQETEAALTYNDRYARDINDMLSVAADSQVRAVSLERKKEDLPYAYTEYTGVFLQPGEVDPPLNGEGKRAYEVRFDTIVNDFLTFLRQHNIFADDVIVTMGQEPPSSMMRQESYVKVEISRIAKTVLLCNQVGEATFVIQGYIPDTVLSRYTKDDLQSNPEYPARKVVRSEQWQAQVEAYLFSEDSWGEKDKREKPPRTKVNVKELVATREQIAQEIREYFTPEAWVELIRDSAFYFKTPQSQHGMTALAGMFGVDGNVRSHRIPRLRLGLAIWPNSELIRTALEKELRTPEQWRLVIENERWTDERWLQMSAASGKEDPQTVKIDDWGLGAISTVFGIKEYYLTMIPRLRLGLAIWPNSELIRTALEKELRTVDEWRRRIALDGWTDEKWMNDIGQTGNRIHPQSVKIDEKGLQALADIFGVSNYVRTQRASHLRLGIAIWPESELIRTALEKETRTVDRWRVVINEQGWSDQRWMAMGMKSGQEDPRTVLIDGVTLRVLKNIFGTSGNPIGNNVDRLRLGIAIWPESELIRTALEKETRTVEQWRTVLNEQGWSDQRWMAMSDSRDKENPAAVKIDGWGLAAIGAVFGVNENPTMIVPRLRLGLAIWPRSELIRTALTTAEEKSRTHAEHFRRTLDQWRQRVNDEGYTPDRWPRMSKTEALALNIDGIAIRRLARIFGVAGDPQSSLLVRFRLGLAIWPDSEVIRQAITEQELLLK